MLSLGKGRGADASRARQVGVRRGRRALSLAAGLLLAGTVEAIDFELEPLAISDYRLDDIGVVDANGDGHLDIFTTNHNGRQLLSLGRGDGQFDHVDFEEIGLSPNPDAPGLADTGSAPEISDAGLYIYQKGGRLNLRRVGMKNLGPLRGTLYLRNEPQVTGSGFTQTTVCDRAPKYRCRVEFELGVPGRIRFDASVFQVPKRLVIDDSVPLGRISLGSIHATPSSHDMTLRLMDRHGLAWSDVNGDGNLDVFISNGAVSGTLERLLPVFPEIVRENELFCQFDGIFKPCPGFSGLDRAFGRSRGVAWLDFDQNGRLDLYMNNHQSPNRLFKRKPRRVFIDRAPALGLAPENSGPAVWFDVDNDLDADMLIAEDDALVLYRRDGGGFLRERVGAYRGGYTVWSRSKFSLFDLGGDGYLDAILASPKGGSLITNNGGTLSAEPAGERGLPDQAYSLDFVDVDNDGEPEVHAVSRNCDGDGLYDYTRDGGFVDSGLLPPLRAAPCGPSRSLWFDADNNGFPDLLMTQRPAGSSDRYWDSSLLRNLGNDNHWLQLRLVGPRRNREAIGAHVTVTAGGRSWRQQVGQFEGSSYSQGHYRLYFGLGETELVDEIEVLWPDGTRDTRAGLSAGRLVVIGYGEP